MARHKQAQGGRKAYRAEKETFFGRDRGGRSWVDLVRCIGLNRFLGVVGLLGAKDGLYAVWVIWLAGCGGNEDVSRRCCCFCREDRDVGE